MIDDTLYTTGWLAANPRIIRHPEAAHLIARQYGRDWKAGRRTAVCAAGLNTPLWQRSVASAYPPCGKAASVDTHQKGGDASAAPFMGSAVRAAQTPNLQDQDPPSCLT